MEAIVEKKIKSIEKTKLRSLLQYFYDWEKKQPQAVYLKQPFGDTWKNYTWAEVGNQARRIAHYLQSLNLPEKSNIGIISKNCAHWLINDLAIMMSGHASAPFYPNLTAPQLKQVLEHSDCKVLFVGKLDNWDIMKEGIPEDVTVITYPHYEGNAKVTDERFILWDDLLKSHEPLANPHQPVLDELMTVIYTSGTTGTPKGVMHNYYSASVAVEYGGAENLELKGPEDRFFSYLPLCHIAERVAIEVGSLYSGGTVFFAESLDTFVKNLQEARPTLFFAVPRIWTKFQMGVLEKLPQKKLDKLLKLPIISGMVKKKIKKGLGLDAVRVAITGAAPMPEATHLWYQKIGLPLQEAYGMTENAAACSVMRRNHIKLGTVGQIYQHAEARIDLDTEEILMRSDVIMKGYYKNPELTAQAVDKDGWLHTGDMGELDSEGFLKITGRVKDLFKTAKGEYVAPGPIEWEFAVNNYIEQICVLGSGLAQPIALLVLSELGQKADKMDVTDSLQNLLEKINKKQINYQRVRKVIITRDSWTIENGLLTPTMKIKRNEMEKKYADKLNDWYEKEEVIIWE